MPKARQKPAYLLHQATGQARCRIDGKDRYLGVYGTPESRERYEEVVREWMLKNGRVDGMALKIDELAIQYVEHARGYYRHADGTPTSEVVILQHAIRPVVRMFGRVRVREFGPLKLKAVRESLIEAGHCRTNINRMVDRIRRMFAWGIENELVPPEMLQALRTVAGLRAGRTEARESDPVKPVDQETVEATLKHLPEVVADMVRLQLLTGARPGEICAMRPADVDRSAEPWTYRPARHKNTHRGKDRRIFIGPQGQQILRPYLLRSAESCCFSPAESERKRAAKRRAERKTPMTPSQAARKPRTREYRDRYTKDSFNLAIRRACEKAQVENWSPNQLRHSRATLLRAQFGIEAAQVVLGHSDPKTTLVYAEAQFSKAAEIARQIG